MFVFIPRSLVTILTISLSPMAYAALDFDSSTDSSAAAPGYRAATPAPGTPRAKAAHCDQQTTQRTAQRSKPGPNPSNVRNPAQSHNHLRVFSATQIRLPRGFAVANHYHSMQNVYHVCNTKFLRPSWAEILPIVTQNSPSKGHTPLKPQHPHERNVSTPHKQQPAHKRRSSDGKIDEDMDENDEQFSQYEADELKMYHEEMREKETPGNERPKGTKLMFD